MNEKTKKIIFWSLGIAGVILALGISVFIYLCYNLINNPFNDTRFSESVWRKYHESDDPDNPRGKMAYHVRDTVLKHEMNQNEVIAILGIPDFDQSEKCLKYNLGMWSGFRMDYDSLDIYFDENGKYSHAKIVQH